MYAISLLRVVEKYHDIIKTCYLQNMYKYKRDKNNHNQRAIIRAKRNRFQSKIDSFYVYKTTGSRIYK